MKKQCSRCKQLKDINEFSKRKTYKDGHEYHCKECSKKYRKDNKDAIKKTNKKYADNNKENSKKKNAEYYKKHKEYIDKRNKKYVEKNKDKRGNYEKEYYQKNKNRLKIVHQKYRNENKEKAKEMYKKNIEKHNERLRRWRKNKLKTDPIFNFTVLTRTRMWYAIKSQSTKKTNDTFKLLGCTGKDALEYLIQNSKYKNNNDLHIDHIVPLSKFNLSKENHQLIAFHFLNLQYLKSTENIIKKDKLEKNWKFIIINICIERQIDSDDIVNYIESAA